jgi:hypothetical protein
MDRKETFKINPHSSKQEQIMTAFMTPGLQEMWIPCGTKFGKTLGGASGIAAGAWVKKQGLFRWVAPIYTQSKIGKRYCERILPDDYFKARNDEPPTVKLHHNGAQIEFWHGKNPESLEGEGVTGGYVLDEVAKMSREVYESSTTTITQTRAPIVGMSTPKGKNHFYEKCMDAKERMEWAKKKGITPTHIFITAATADNPYVPRQSIEDAKARLPDRLFRQYYLAEFLDDSAVFVGFRDAVEDGEPIGLESYGRQFWLDTDASKRKVVISADWGKSVDYTVFIAMDYESKPRRVVGLQRFNGISYVQSVKELYHFCNNFKQVGLVKHDITGVGGGIDDMIAQVNLPVEGVHFTNRSKSEMVNQLILAFQKNEISLPNWPEMIRELDAFEVVTTSLGNYRYAAPEGGGVHDDIVITLMLANAAALEYGGEFSIRFLEDLPSKRGQMDLNKWYSELIQDDNDGPFPSTGWWPK